MPGYPGIFSFLILSTPTLAVSGLGVMRGFLGFRRGVMRGFGIRADRRVFGDYKAIPKTAWQSDCQAVFTSGYSYLASYLVMACVTLLSGFMFSQNKT